MSYISSYIRGSQTSFHALRMFGQSVKHSFQLWLFMMLVFSIPYFFIKTNAHVLSLSLLGNYLISCLDSVFSYKRIIEFTDLYGVPIKLSNGAYVLWYESRVLGTITRHLRDAALFGGICAVGGISLFFFYVYNRGRKQSQNKFLRGAKVVSAVKLKRLLRLDNLKHFNFFPYSIANFQYPRYAHNQHTLITGGSGTGKTQVMLELVSDLRSRKEKIVIYDCTGTFVRKFYDPAKDIILNPYDARSKNWNFFTEGRTASVFNSMASALIEESKYDPFWAKAARSILTETALKLVKQGNPSNQALCDTILKLSSKDFAAFFKATDVASIADDTSEKTIASIRSVLTTYAKTLAMLKDADKVNADNTQQQDTVSSDDTTFSIKKWIQNQNRDSILFLTSRYDVHETIKPLSSLWINLAISEVLSLDQEKRNQTWFLIDEMPSLQKLPILQTGLAQGRQYGMAFIITTQLISQLRELYGNNGATTISGLCRNRLIFTTPDPETALWCSDNLGKKETLVTKESISFGASEYRDGINLNQQKESENLVIPTEIMNLRDLQFYLKMSGGFPVAKGKIEYVDRTDVADKMVEADLSAETKNLTTTDYDSHDNVSLNHKHSRKKKSIRSTPRANSPTKSELGSNRSKIVANSTKILEATEEPELDQSELESDPKEGFDPEYVKTDPKRLTASDKSSDRATKINFSD